MVWRECCLHFISHSLPILERTVQSSICTIMYICSRYLGPQILLFLSLVIPLFSLFRLQTEILESCNASSEHSLGSASKWCPESNCFSSHLWLPPWPWSPSFLLLIIIVALYFPIPTKNLFSGVKVRYFKTVQLLLMSLRQNTFNYWQEQHNLSSSLNLGLWIHLFLSPSLVSQHQPQWPPCSSPSHQSFWNCPSLTWSAQSLQ